MAAKTASTPTVLQSCLSSSWGGLEMVAFENAVALNKNNIHCCTLCIENSPLERHLKAIHLPTLLLSVRRDLADYMKVRRFVADNNIHTVLVQVLKDVRFLAIALIFRQDIRMVAISHTFLNVDKKDLFHRWSYRKIEKLICLTELQKSNLLSHLPVTEEQMAVIPNYVDCSHFHPSHCSDQIRESLHADPGISLLGIASRLDPQKGQDVALHAVHLLKAKNIFVKLVLIGENTLHEADYAEYLKRLARELQIENQVFFAGFRDDIECVMASLDMLLMPSMCETFGRVLIEAMASKTPVIATRNGGVPNIVIDNQDGLLVSPKSPEELATAIERLLGEEGLEERLTENAYLKVQASYSKEVVEEKFLQLLKSS